MIKKNNKVKNKSGAKSGAKSRNKSSAKSRNKSSAKSGAKTKSAAQINKQNPQADVFELDKIKFKDDEIVFFALGGLAQVGCNMMLLGFRGSWIIIDSGVGYGVDNYLGLDMMVVNPDALLKIRRKIKAIILTHAHDDHIAALQFLWPTLKLPIYTGNFTKFVLLKKLQDNGYNYQPKIHVIDQNSKLQIEQFNIKFIPVNHTIPDNFGLIINMDKVNLYHTSDWSVRLKHNNFNEINEPTKKTLDTLKKLENLIVLSDSTNAEEEGFNPSEDFVAHNLEKAILNSKNRVIVTLFSSNIERLINLVKIAKATKRVAILTGRSMNRNWESAKKANLIPASLTNVKDSANYKDHDKDNGLIICTGCQGEPNSALTLISSNQHPLIELKPSDTIIFSSSIIPGNEIRVANIKNNLARGLAKVIQEENIYHASGHAKSQEIEWFYKSIKPKLVIPIHGEIRQRAANSYIAKACSIESILVDNHQVLTINQQLKTSFLGEIEAPPLVFDGKKLMSFNSLAIKQRRASAQNGSGFISLAFDKNYKIIPSSVIISVAGLDYDYNPNYDTLRVMTLKYVNTFDLDIDYPYEVAEIFKNGLRKACNQIFGKKPNIVVHINFKKERFSFFDFSKKN